MWNLSLHLETVGKVKQCIFIYCKQCLYFFCVCVCVSQLPEGFFFSFFLPGCRCDCGRTPAPRRNQPWVFRLEDKAEVRYWQVAHVCFSPAFAVPRQRMFFFLPAEEYLGGNVSAIPKGAASNVAEQPFISGDVPYFTHTHNHKRNEKLNQTICGATANRTERFT